MKRLIRLGSVSFLNAKPLTYALENNLIKHEFDIIQTPPSELSQKLYKKEVDIGLIPVAELLKRKNYRVVPDLSISSIGKVDSVILFSKTDLKNISKVAVDKRSQSSTALLRIVLEIFNDINPEYIPTDIDSEGYMNDFDSAMLIGDSGLRKFYNHGDKYKVYDLGEIWTEQTGLPFVYAVFAVNQGVRLGKNLDAMVEGKNCGIKSIEEISIQESKKLGIDYKICKTYLTDRIKYDLGVEEKKGIIKYSELLSELGQSEKISELDMYSE